MKVEILMYNGNVQQNPLCAASFVPMDLPISPRFSPTIFCRDATLTRTLSYSSRLYAQNPVFVSGALLWNCSSTEREHLSTYYVQRECSAEPFMCSILSLWIFPSLPGSRLRFFVAMLLLLEHLCTAVCGREVQPVSSRLVG